MFFSRELLAQEATPPVQNPSPQSSPTGYPYSQMVEDDWKVNNPLIPYRDRRSTWGGTVQIGYSNFSPMDYDPDFVTDEEYDTFYGEVDQAMLEGQFSGKLNFSFASLSVDLGVGHAENNGKFGANLSITPLRLGATLALDGIFAEPYLVPYGFVGAYVVYYKESLASQSVEGRTSPSLYYGGGVRLQLDWLDPSADDEALIGMGLENTYLFAEARSFSESGDLVPDLSSPEDSPFMINAGLTLEF
jgi:hypothetical protein